MLQISNKVAVPLREIEISAIRAQGAGGQNVNKVSTAIHLRFNIRDSSLPDFYKIRLLNLRDRRITKEGVVVIKAQRHRTQDKNKEEAFRRLQDLIRGVTVQPKERRPTLPTRSSRERRMDCKTKRGQAKTLRRKAAFEDMD